MAAVLSWLISTSGEAWTISPTSTLSSPVFSAMIFWVKVKPIALLLRISRAATTPGGAATGARDRRKDRFGGRAKSPAPAAKDPRGIGQLTYWIWSASVYRCDGQRQAVALHNRLWSASVYRCDGQRQAVAL